MTPIELEIGMGRAHFLFERASIVPTHQVVGIEYKERWVKQALRKQQREQIYNVTPIHGDAWEVVPQLFKPESLSLIILNFPDPWWKKRHHKRRVLNENFLEILVSLLKPDGQFFFQSDVLELFEIYSKLLESKLKKLPCETNPLGAKSHREKKCEEFEKPVYRILLFKNNPLNQRLASSSCSSVGGNLSSGISSDTTSKSSSKSNKWLSLALSSSVKCLVASLALTCA